MPTAVESPKAVPVRAHRFRPGREYTLGVEEELMLVDADTLALAAGAERVLADVGSERIKPELMQCQVEIASRPHGTATELLEDLIRLRRQVARSAGLAGLRVVAAGTHPFSLAEDQPITQRDRYRELVAALRYPVRREVCFGMHVHVAVAGADKAVAVVEGLLPDLPLLLALSASSPFWRGEETGLASTRTAIFDAMPRSGLPPRFSSFEEYAASVERLSAAGALPDHSYLWWDARPHPAHGTVEVRLMDVQPGVRDAAALAAIVQALVRHLGRRFDRGDVMPRESRFVLGENRWLAARHGLRARLVGSAPHDHIAIGVPALVGRLLDRIEDDALALGCDWALDHVERLAHGGGSTDRQLRRRRAGAELPSIVRALAAETATVT